MVIVIAGVLATMSVGFITKPMEGYVDLARRAELVDSAEMSMRQMAREIRRALPNSVRIIDGGNGIEVINTVAGGRYRALPQDDGTGDPLDFTVADASFEIIGNSLPTSITNERLVIYNLGVAGADAYNEDDVITPGSTSISIAGTPQIVSLNPGHQFPYTSPRQRIFMVDGIVRFHCGGSSLSRYTYAIGGAVGAGVPVTGNIESCNFVYTDGTASRSALVTIRMTLEDGGERITLLHQVHVDNVP